MSEFRHEYKYICDMRQLTEIKYRIAPFMKLDSHTGENTGYVIRSLYFDDYDNTCYYDNLNGADPREKFRIRIYNGDDSFVRLELKQKVHGMTRKVSCPLSREDVRMILQGEKLNLRTMDSALLRKFYIQQQVRLLKPKVIVEYDRIPFVYKEGNVRVTFDMNIRSCSNVEDFLNKDIHTRQITETGCHVLEVKFDEFIPDFIHHAIQIEKLQQTAFSKYSLCRKYNLRGVI